MAAGSRTVEGASRQAGVEELHRLAIFAIFAAAVGAGALGETTPMVLGSVGAVVGYAFAVGISRLWGPRTRPKNSPLWWLLGAAWLLFVFWASVDSFGPSIFYAGALMALGFGLASRHDLGTAPSLLLAGAVLTSLLRAGRLEGGVEGVAARAPTLGDADATWIAITVLLGIVAATLEHDRLTRRTWPGTPMPWTVIRLAFVSIWTMVVLALREDIQWGRLFVLLGANLEGQGGQMLLIGILLVALVVAALALRPRQERQRGPGGAG